MCDATVFSYDLSIMCSVYVVGQDVDRGDLDEDVIIDPVGDWSNALGL